MDRSAGNDPLVGRLLDGRYEVGPRIARGGMATVYEATDLRLDRRVAIKVVQHALADDDDFAERFVREARAAARLTHPNVVAVYDQGEDDGTLFLTMEFVAGRHTLRDLIRDEAPLTPIRALALLEDVLKALAAAHESGIVHRDIKPENVLIDPRGLLKVADFGLARAISAATSATRTGGVLMGTVSYLPPELLTDGIADARSDVYSLGVLLFELLTGTKPHAGDNPIQVAYKHVHNDVPAPSSIVDGIPPYLDAFVSRATSRQHDLRPADAHVMLQQMRRVRQALLEGLVDDPELTDDLTPTIAIATEPGQRRPLATNGPDEVFDVAAYDDFRADVNPGPDFVPPMERTLVVGEARLPRQSPSPESADGASTGGYEPGAAHDASTVAAAVQSGATPAAGGAEGATPGRAPYRRRRRGWIAFLLVLVLAAAAAVTGWYYGVGRFQATPDVVRLTETQAEQRITAAGLTFKIAGTSYSETVDAGRVIETDPAPGDKVVEDGGTVKVWLSKGPERHKVPDLTDMSESQAIQAITDASLSVAKPVRRWSETVPTGQVLDFEPKEGTELRRDAPVTLVVSKGPPPIEIVDYRGESADDAEAALTEAGFTVAAKKRYNDDVEDGLVIRQRPAKGVGHRGDEISLVVSLGPHLVEVPDVYRSGETAAKETLIAAGFTVKVAQYTPYLGFHVVAGQSPDGGSKAPLGSEVTIYVI